MNNRWSGTSFGWLVGCVLFFANLHCEAQNLVGNHSFEERNDCVGLNQVHYPETGPSGWFSGGWTPDYFQTCLGSGASFGVPLSYWCFQYPQDGESYVGMMTYDQQIGGREYFMTELLEPLVPGQTYYASFYANAGWGGPQPQVWLASSGVGLLFTMQARQWGLDDPAPIGVGYAHIFHSGILADTVEWVLVSGSFLADSAYQYIMIGNQFGNAHTDTLHFAALTGYARAYTLVDNVCVSTSPLGCPMVTSVLENTIEVVSPFPNPATDVITISARSDGSHISIVDAVGRSIWDGVISSGSMVLDVQAWARGTYIVRMRAPEGSGLFKFVLIE